MSEARSENLIWLLTSIVVTCCAEMVTGLSMSTGAIGVLPYSSVPSKPFIGMAVWLSLRIEIGKVKGMPDVATEPNLSPTETTYSLESTPPTKWVNIK